jgi:3-hydroxyisobutyrate dehydrogenase-like beta-hydroxyacid dehydrogenase
MLTYACRGYEGAPVAGECVAAGAHFTWFTRAKSADTDAEGAGRGRLCLLTYAGRGGACARRCDVCWHMLTYAVVCW